MRRALLKRFIGSLGLGIATVILLDVITYFLPGEYPPPEATSLHSLLWHLKNILIVILDWSEVFLARLFPRAPGDIINFQCILAIEVFNFLLAAAVFYFVFTLLARRKLRERV